MRGLAGKVVLVTGSASGIGQACVERLAAEGTTAVGADIAESASASDHFVLDVTDPDAVRATVEEIASRYGRLDGVVNAAGVLGLGPAHLIEIEEWERVLRINLTGTFLVCRFAITAMLSQERLDGERGSIVNLASIEGLEGMAAGTAYNASKGGVVLLTRNLAIDYGRKGIRANALCPGFIETPMIAPVFNLPGMDGLAAEVREEHKLRRLGQPEEVAAVACFLLSADASFVSGSAITVDGGYTAGRDHGATQLFGL